MLIGLVVGLGPQASGAEHADPEPGHGFSALVFSRTAGFRHDSIPAGITAITELGAAHDFGVTATEDPAVFSDAGLAEFAVVIFLNTTGDVLSAEQQAAFERYVAAGGGFVGVHAAADTEYEWAWYGDLVGAWFASHPAIQEAEVRVLDRSHPSTEGLPARWGRTDEWYDYQTNPRGQAHILATLDATSYSGSTMGTDHPIAWCRTYAGGRSWYTGMGHTAASYSEEGYRNHLLGGIEWAAGAADGDCSATIGSNFQLETLENNVDSPMDLVVLPDGSVLFVELGGQVKRWSAGSQTTTVVNRLDVFQDFEDGLLGIELDPDFAMNNWVYLFYSPAGSQPKQHVSRFDWTGSTLDLSSEKILLEIGTQRDECCHSGGSMAFGPDGNLFISTGDNTNPFASNGYAPIDERPGRGAWDAQGSSANTADLRGKILRITPMGDGTYTVPEGNLFPGGTGGRPEIFAMGLRNPFRISVDQTRGWLYWGDVGPDARNDHATLGSKGYDEWNQARAAGHFGWPYCIGPNLPYGDRDFDTDAVSGLFDCAAPINDSPNNTGARELPPAQPAWIWYPYDPSVAFPGIPNGGGRTAMAGPVYTYDAGRSEGQGLPSYYHDRFIAYEWSRSYVLVITLDEDGAPLSIDPLPGDRTLAQPISMKQGPDGSLYLLEWGTGFGTGNPDARLSRISFAAGGRRPVAVIQADPPSGPVPLAVEFSAAASYDPDGDPITFSWDLDGDGMVDATGATASWTYGETGDYLVVLTARDPQGNQSQDSFSITAGNTRPEITIESPFDRGFVRWGDEVAYRLAVSDAEDGSTDSGTIDCASVQVQVYIGHDAHTHPLTSTTGCEGVITVADGHGDEGDNLFHVVEFTYTDAGAGNAAPIAVVEERILLPTRLEAEHYADQSGVQTEETTDPLGGGINTGWIENGDWLRFDGINLSGIDFVSLRVASAGAGGTVELRRTGPTGPRIGEAIIQNTGGWQTWRDVTIPVLDPVNEGPLFLVFEGAGGSSLFNVNYLVFHGPGASTRPAAGSGFEAEHLVPQGQRRLSRVEPQVSFDWGAKAPIVAASAFESRWEGLFWPPAEGSYRFTLRVQGTGAVTVDGISVLSRTSPQTISEQRSASIDLAPSRPVPVVATYASGSGGSAIWVEVEGPGMPRQSLGGSLVTPGLAIGVVGDEELPSHFSVSALYPNPTSGASTLDLELPTSGRIVVEVFDLLGRRVLPRREVGLGAGKRSLGVDTALLGPGVYFVSVSGAAGTATRSLVRIR